MTGSNHALTGAIIAAATGNPIAAATLAFASHFVLDGLPHFGEAINPLSKFTKKVWLIDFILLSSLMLFLVYSSNWLMFLGAVVAISPDFAWVYRFVFLEKLGKIQPSAMKGLNKFHSGIQKFETKAGIIIEVVWFCIASLVLYSLVS